MRLFGKIKACVNFPLKQANNIFQNDIKGVSCDNLCERMFLGLYGIGNFDKKEKYGKIGCD